MGEDHLSVEHIHTKMVGKYKVSRKELLKKFAIFIIPIIIAIAISTLFLASDLLVIEKVEIQRVDGEDFVYLNIDQVNLRASEEIKGQKLPKLSIPDTKKLIEESSPFVKNVYIEKIFPNKIDIRIEERTPFLLVKTDIFCAILDPENSVLDLESSGNSAASEEEVVPTESGFFDCEDLQSRYPVVVLQSLEIKADFVVGEKSTFYEAEKILLMQRIITAQGYEIDKITLKDQVYTVQLLLERTLTFSSQQDMDAQLKRFILVSSQIGLDELDFKSLDLRYDRPVLIEP